VLEIMIDCPASVILLVSRPLSLVESMIGKVFEMVSAWPSLTVVG
jgi:hypothetical protein